MKKFTGLTMLFALTFFLGGCGSPASNPVAVNNPPAANIPPAAVNPSEVTNTPTATKTPDANKPPVVSKPPVTAPPVVSQPPVVSKPPVITPPVVSQPPAPPTNGTQTEHVSIAIQNFAFDPQTKTVAKGATVTWTNNDSVPHQIKSTTFNSGMLAQGQSYSFTFNAAGSFDYICSVHPSMTGTIIVQ